MTEPCWQSFSAIMVWNNSTIIRQ